MTHNKAIQIIVPVNHSFQLQLEQLKQILEADDIKDRYVVIVSIAGASRKGKSFLLNFYLKYLYAKVMCQIGASFVLLYTILRSKFVIYYNIFPICFLNFLINSTKNLTYRIGLATIYCLDLGHEVAEWPKRLEFGCGRTFSLMILKAAKRWPSFCWIRKEHLTIEAA